MSPTKKKELKPAKQPKKTASNKPAKAVKPEKAKKEPKKKKEQKPVKKAEKPAKPQAKKPAKKAQKQEIAAVEAAPIAEAEAPAQKQEIAPIEQQEVVSVEENGVVPVEQQEVTEVNQQEVTAVEENPLIVDAQTINYSEYDHKKIDNDMKYKAPLSYRWFRILGWLFLAVTMVCSVVGGVLSIGQLAEKISPEELRVASTVLEVLSLLSALPLPLFLIANFSVILQGKGNYKKLMLRFGGLTLGIYVAFIIVFYHYIVMLLMKAQGISFFDARNSAAEIITSMGSEGGLVVNVFVDLFMCVLIMFFIDYDPKKHFQGKKIILFRLLVILPIAYEFMSATFMGLMTLSDYVEGFHFALPPEVLPLIGKKPIMMIIAFVVICFYIKGKRKRYLKKGGTPEGYEAYLKTNRNAFKFSLTASIIFLIAAIADFGGFIGLYVIFGVNDPEYVDTMINIVEGFTLGKSMCLILVIPFMMLYSYLKQHKNPKADIFVPVGGIVFLIFAIFESAFLGLLWLM